MPRAEIHDQNHRSLGYIDLPAPRPAGPAGPPTLMGTLFALLCLVAGLATVVLFVMAANEPGPGDPGYCYEKVVVGHNSLGVPQFACVDEVP